MLRNFLTLVYGGIPARFESDFPLEESVRRLRQRTKRSVFSALFRQSAVGVVTERRVKLQRVIPFFGNSFKPIFIGKFVVDRGCVILAGQFTMFTYTKVFMTMWFGFAIVWTFLTGILALLVMLVTNRPTEEVPTILFPLVGVAFVGIGVSFVRFAWSWSRGDIAYLSQVIEQALTTTRGT